MVSAIFVFGRNCTLRFRFLFRFRRKSQTKIRKSLICAAALYQFKAGRRTITIGDCVVNWSQCDVGPGLDIFIASPDSPLLLRHMQAARRPTPSGTASLKLHLNESARLHGVRAA